MKRVISVLLNVRDGRWTGRIAGVEMQILTEKRRTRFFVFFLIGKQVFTQTADVWVEFDQYGEKETTWKMMRKEK